MSSTSALSRPEQHPGAGPVGSPGQPVMPRLAPPARKRRPLVVALGLLAIVLGGLAAAAAIYISTDNTAVLALARPVQVGQTIESADLTVAQIPLDPALKPIAAGDRSTVVGRKAAVDLVPGQLLTQESLTDAPVPGSGESLVAVPTKAGQAPARALVPGDKVLAVLTPGDAQGGSSGLPEGQPIAAKVVGVSAVDDNGITVIDLVVPAADGPKLAALSSTGRVALVLQARG